MANGYAGKILRINLSDKSIGTINTKDYEQWGGGHGMGSAIFFDLCKDKTIDGYDPKNVVTLFPGNFAGTNVPAASSRTEVQGIGIHGWPTGWFTRSNFGGRWGAMLKFAGWDGVVIEGKADKPVWINVINDKVSIEDAGSLWGMDAWASQEEIWRMVSGSSDLRDWTSLNRGALGGGRDVGRTTQKPAVVTIGLAGEKQARVAALVHDAGNGAGQGGFGGIFGAKNLKAISVWGSGNVEVANPKALIDARMWIARDHHYNVDNPRKESPKDNNPFYGGVNHSPGYGWDLIGKFDEPSRPQGCTGCFINCRARTASSVANESQCVEGLWYSAAKTRGEYHRAVDLTQKLGINAYQVIQNGWLNNLYKMGELGPGKRIPSDLPLDKYGTFEWAEALCDAIANQTDIGKDLANGMVRAAEAWGRLDDLKTGLLAYPQWGYTEHYDPRLETDWSYGSLFGDRDINEHDFNWPVHWNATMTAAVNEDPTMTAEELVNLMAEKCPPFNDPMMFDYSKEGIYSEGRLKAVQWLRRYTRFWKQSAGLCDWQWASFVDVNAPDQKGFTPEAEPKFWEAVTGNKMSFEEGLELGQKIWNLDRSIWVLQGRHRDQEVYSEYVYTVPTKNPYFLTIYEGGEWKYDTCIGRVLERDKFEDFKTRFYKAEGWDESTGWPTKDTLSKLGLDNVASELSEAGKLK
ncbi:MAG: aldehyde ferredoxin oxidoreductase N-terminal domain-containing protein [Candidatus Aquicultorales bacterium]